MEKNSSKIIPASSARGVEQWQPPQVQGQTSGHGGNRSHLMTASQLEEIQNKAFEEGYEQGRREGFEYGHKEALAEGRATMRQLSERMTGLLATLDAPLKQLDEQVEQELITLVISMVRQLVRREVRTDPNQIIGVVREALGILPVASRNVRLVLHPDDAKLIREIYALSEAELGWTIVEDPVLNRGGCRLTTDISQIDATLESRLANLIAPLLGGERSEDDEDPDAIEAP